MIHPVEPGTRVALISTAAVVHLDEDLPLLVAELASLDVAAEVVDWHDEGYPWDEVRLAVVQSTWDYTTQVEDFVRRLTAIDAVTTLANPLDVIRWNIDKRYLIELDEAGVPVVPTTILRPGEDVTLPSDVTVVVKPSVSAGARDTEHFGPGRTAAAAAHARRLLAAGRSVLVQPYMESVEVAGETGLVYVGDRFCHAFRKGPILRPGSAFVEDLYREELIEPREASAAERIVAEQVLDSVASVLPARTRADLLYARVDLVRGPDGPALMELELIEPSLFLTTSRGAGRRTAEAVLSALHRPTA